LSGDQSFIQLCAFPLICENGVKHVTWEQAPATADRDFLAAHSVSELAEWSDYYDLEAVGRLVDMHNRGFDEFDRIDVMSMSDDGSERTLYRYRAVRSEVPPGNAAGYIPELNVLCGIADRSAQSQQPVTKHLVVEITPSYPAVARQ
jgi:hypothetical protein